MLKKAHGVKDMTIIKQVKEEVEKWDLKKDMYHNGGIGKAPMSQEDFVETLKDKGLIEDTIITNNKITVRGTEIDLSGATEQTYEKSRYDSEEGINTPAIEDGMIPIKWNGTAWEICSCNDKNWYEYKNQTTIGGTESNWANVMLSDGKSGKTKADIGATIDAEDLRKYVCLDTKIWI